MTSLIEGNRHYALYQRAADGDAVPYWRVMSDGPPVMVASQGLEPRGAMSLAALVGRGEMKVNPANVRLRVLYDLTLDVWSA